MRSNLAKEVLVVLLVIGSSWACSSGDSGEGAKDVPVQDTVGEDQLMPEVAPDVPTGTDLPDEDSGMPTLPPGKSFGTVFAAGAASVTINGTKPDYLLGGYGLCLGKVEACRISEGIHDDLMANAVALAHPESGEVVILVGLDSVGLLGYDIKMLQDMVPKAFADELGVKMDGPRVVVGASHSHDSPDTVGLWGPMDKKVRDEIEYIEYMQQKVIEVAIAAYKNLGDIELVWGKSAVVNDDLDEFSDDHDVFVLQGKRPGGGASVFTWVRANAHTTVYPMENNGLSADWVGPFRKKLMDSGFGVVVFHNGPIGSVYPKDPEVCEEEDAFPDGWKDPDLKPEDFAKVTCVGYEYADAALAAVAQAKPLSAEAGIKFRHVTYGFHPTNFALMQLGVIGPLPIPNIDTKDFTQLMDSYFSWITIGELELLTTPGESFPTFAAHAKEVLAQATEGTAIVLGLTQDWLGYLIPVKMWEDPALDYHRTISPGETVEPAYLEALQQLVDKEKE